MTITEATDRAAEGRLADGYACLLWSRQRAEEMAAEGMAWGAELGRGVGAGGRG